MTVFLNRRTVIFLLHLWAAGSPHAPTPEAEARWAAASTHPDAGDLAEAAAYMKKFVDMYDKFYKFM